MNRSRAESGQSGPAPRIRYRREPAFLKRDTLRHLKSLRATFPPFITNLTL
jgi:hypothetical protein